MRGGEEVSCQVHTLESRWVRIPPPHHFEKHMNDNSLQQDSCAAIASEIYISMMKNKPISLSDIDLEKCAKESFRRAQFFVDFWKSNNQKEEDD
jgi:hypothetical protein